MLKIKQNASTQTASTHSIEKPLPSSNTPEVDIKSFSLGLTPDNNRIEVARSIGIPKSATSSLEDSFERCSLSNKPPLRSSSTSYSVMLHKRRQQKQIFTTEHLFSTCHKCRSKMEEGHEKPLVNSTTRSRRIQRRSWPIYNPPNSKKLATLSFDKSKKELELLKNST